jgi:hypothetical protein
MIVHKKRHGGEAVAPEAPEYPSPCEAHAKIDPNHIRAHLAEFPAAAWKDSAEWHMQHARRARSVDALKYHLRLWAVRWACYMRSIRSGWVYDYAHMRFDSAAKESGLNVRFRKRQVVALCNTINRIVWGED